MIDGMSDILQLAEVSITLFLLVYVLRMQSEFVKLLAPMVEKVALAVINTGENRWTLLVETVKSGENERLETFLKTVESLDDNKFSALMSMIQNLQQEESSTVIAHTYRPPDPHKPTL